MGVKLQNSKKILLKRKCRFPIKEQNFQIAITMLNDNRLSGEEKQQKPKILYPTVLIC